MNTSRIDTQRIVEILRSVPGTEQARTVLFGSQARGDAVFGSDIDIGIESVDGTPLPHGLLADIEEAFDNSSLEERVQVVDLARASAAFRREALSHAILL